MNIYAKTYAASQINDYDLEAIRQDFPILSREIYGKQLVYLDNAASAQKPFCVLEKIRQAYEQDYANVHRGLHFLANASTQSYEGARETVARFLNAPAKEEVIFTRSSTEAINMVASSFGGMVLGEGDEVVLSIMEHHSNIVPWHFHRQNRGAVLRWVDVHRDGSFDVERFKKALSPRTKIVAITHMSNVLGTIVPVKEIVEIAHARNIPVLIDGSQGAVHMPVDVQDIDCDFYVMTGHKLYAPTGIGVLYAKKQHLEAMPPYMGGGEMISMVSRDAVSYGVLPNKFEAGTPPIVQAIGLGRALDYMEKLGRKRIADHECALKVYAQERLSAIKSLCLHGTGDHKGAIFSFNMEGVHPHDVATILDRQAIAVRAGTHCAEPLLAELGINATCRASFGLYNTLEDVDRLADGLEKAHKFFL